MRRLEEEIEVAQSRTGYSVGYDSVQKRTNRSDTDIHIRCNGSPHKDIRTVGSVEYEPAECLYMFVWSKLDLVLTDVDANCPILEIDIGEIDSNNVSI